MTNSKYGKLLYILTSVFSIAGGILLIVLCAHLFFTGGDNPYSRARVGEYLSYFIAPAILTLLSIIGGLVFDAVTGVKNGMQVKLTASEMLSAYSVRVDDAALSDEGRLAVEKERRARRLASILSVSASALFIIGAILYFVFCTSFTVENLNGDVLGALAGVLPLCVAAVALHVPKAYFIEKSSERELAMLKEEVKRGVALSKMQTLSESKRERNYVLIARIAIACVGIIFVILGILNGGMADVLQKAVKICTECIGLG